MKVHELAKELGQSPKEILRILRTLGINARKLSSKVDQSSADRLRKMYDVSSDKGTADRQERSGEIVKTSESSMTVRALSEILGVALSDIMRTILKLGFVLNLNSEIDSTTAVKIADSLGIELVVEEVTASGVDIKAHMKKIVDEEKDDGAERRVVRPPVITVMGHVDHGKTLLLDAIRKTDVVGKEEGGITQHIGAYQVHVNDKKLTFLDTPGHAAFTAIRARGSQLTDIIVLVVAADEGVKPQTEEALHHAKAANVPIVVALNKIDKPEADLEMCKQQLSQHGLVAEDWGGDTVIVPVSAKSRKGLDDLLEMLVLVSDMLELTCLAEGPAKAIVIESRLSREKGAVATVLVKSGLLKLGDHFLIGNVVGKVRALLNDAGQSVKEADPGMPVEILGISEVPSPGALLEAFDSEKAAKLEAQQRRLNSQGDPTGRKQQGVSLDTLVNGLEKGEMNVLNVVLKGDVQGSVEAIAASMQQFTHQGVAVHVVHAATGQVSENDVMLAAASSALVIAFNVPVGPDARSLAEEHGVEIRKYSILYKILDDLEKILAGLYQPTYEEVEVGRAEVRQLFRYSKIGVIAGSYVTDGKLVRNSIVKVIRNKKEVFSGKMASLKRFKDDVKEVLTGFECGVVLENIRELQEGDLIVCYELVEKKV